ncbi:MAG: hypothetical protein ACI4DY_06285 [Monoglobaceae bacterium]
MSKIKKCITMLLALAVVLSVVQIPAFAAETVYFDSDDVSGENLGSKTWYPIHTAANYDATKYAKNCTPNFAEWGQTGSTGVSIQPGDSDAGAWLKYNTTLGGNQAKVWLKFDNAQTIPKDQSFIVECNIRGYKGGEYIMGMIADKLYSEYDPNNESYNLTYTDPAAMNARFTGALFGRGSDNILKVNTNSAAFFSGRLKDSNGSDVYAPNDTTDKTFREWSEGTENAEPDGTNGWHKYKIYCDASKHTDSLYMDVTITDVTDSANPIVYQTIKNVGSSTTDGNWTGIFFMNNSTNAKNTKFVEFSHLKVYAPETFAVPTFSSSVELKDSSDATVGDTVAVGTAVKANMTVTNTVGVQGNAYLILAEYDSTGTLVNVKVNSSYDLTQATTETKIATDPITLSNAGGTVKAFLWTDKLRALNKADTATITAAE